MIVAIGSDHAGYEYKEAIVEYIKEMGHQIEDYGTHTADSVDYPDFAHPVSKRVNLEKNILGILICGSGNGVSMTANKYTHIRAALCWNAEIAELARQHNNANVCSIPARFISVEEAKLIVNKFILTEFEGGRHKRRVDKISSC